MSNTPSDEEISAAISAAKVKCVHPEAETTINIARAVLAKWGAPQPVVREPLTEEQIAEGFANRSRSCGLFAGGVRFAERAHGITQKGGKDADTQPN